MGAEARVKELGLILPPSPKVPAPVRIPFEWVWVIGDRAYLSGHGAQDESGAPSMPFGRVPDEVTVEAAQTSARSAAISMLSSLRRGIGDLDRVRAWLLVSTFVNAAPGFAQTTAVANPVSDLLIEVFGELGRHARTAIGVSTLPLNLPIIVSAEVLIAP